jgi:hypothetical protein
MAFVIGKVRAIILPLPSGLGTRDLGDHIGWSFICALEMAHARGTSFSLGLRADGIADSHQGMLTRVELVGVERHDETLLLVSFT